jgi:hypothetical protein
MAVKSQANIDAGAGLALAGSRQKHQLLEQISLELIFAKSLDIAVQELVVILMLVLIIQELVD